eukprot:scaffold74437_cov60-Phaeocystis_antarctica.AAC.2
MRVRVRVRVRAHLLLRVEDGLHPCDVPLRGGVAQRLAVGDSLGAAGVVLGAEAGRRRAVE